MDEDFLFSQRIKKMMRSIFYITTSSLTSPITHPNLVMISSNINLAVDVAIFFLNALASTNW
jgi:hypothetical protein